MAAATCGRQRIPPAVVATLACGCLATTNCASVFALSDFTAVADDAGLRVPGV